MPRKDPSPLPSQPRRGPETRGDDLTGQRAKRALKSAPPQRAGNASNRYKEDADPSGWSGGESTTNLAGDAGGTPSKRGKIPDKANPKPPAVKRGEEKAFHPRSRPGRKDSPRSDDKKGAVGEGERWYGRGWSDPQKGLQRPSRGETKPERQVFGKKTQPAAKRRR